MMKFMIPSLSPTQALSAAGYVFARMRIAYVPKARSLVETLSGGRRYPFARPVNQLIGFVTAGPGRR
jgi:hypothetical protein